MNGCTGNPVETWREDDSFAQTYRNCNGWARRRDNGPYRRSTLLARLQPLD